MKLNLLIIALALVILINESHAAWKNTIVLKKKYQAQLTRELSTLYSKSIDNSLPSIQFYSTNITKAMFKMRKVLQYSTTNFPQNKDLISFTKACMDNLVIHNRDVKLIAMNGAELQELKKLSFDEYVKEIKNYTDSQLGPYSERIDQCRLNCLLLNMNSYWKENKAELEEAISKVLKSRIEIFEKKIKLFRDILMKFMNSIFNRYKSCTTTNEIEKCLDSTLMQIAKKNNQSLKLKILLTKARKFIFDHLKVAGPTPAELDEQLDDFEEDIEEILKKCHE